MLITRKTGKKGRKYGRREKKPCQQRYTNEKRWNANKLKRAKRNARKFGKPIRIKINGEWEEIRPE